MLQPLKELALPKQRWKISHKITYQILKILASSLLTEKYNKGPQFGYKARTLSAKHAMVQNGTAWITLNDG